MNTIASWDQFKPTTTGADSVSPWTNTIMSPDHFNHKNQRTLDGEL